MDEEEKIINEEAYDLLDQAMVTSKHVSKSEIEKDEIDWDNVYPTSKEETEEMEALLEQAWQAADDPNEQKFNQRYSELREIVDWSKKRHRTWAWSLIAGALLGAGLFWYMNDDSQKEADKRRSDLATVEAWAPSDTTVSYQNCPSEFYGMYDKYGKRASYYKLFKLATKKSEINSCEASIKQYKNSLDTCKTEDRKERYKRDIESTEDRITKIRAEYDSINAMQFDEIKEMAIKDFTKKVEWKQDDADSNRNYMIYLFVLIPLYIIASYPRGYTITRHRTRQGCITAFKKIGFGIASFCFGAGVAMALLPDYVVKTTYSSGRTETSTESNPLNIAVLIMKFGLMIVGAIIFIFVSALIMTLETIFGLYSNFDWGKWFAAAKAKITEKKQGTGAGIAKA
jgi:hypothetical protein